MSSKDRNRKLPVDKGIQQLRLVYSTNTITTPLRQRTTRQITQALMNRLGIPDSSTLVGILGVGLTGCNMEELSKWVTQQLKTVNYDDPLDALSILELRFRETID